MKFVGKILLAIIANAFALLLAKNIVSGFVLLDNFFVIIEVAAVFTAINLFLKPILKLILGPIIILTLGLGLIVVNAALLKLLDFLSKDLTIENIIALLYATLIISAVNVIVHLATRSK